MARPSWDGNQQIPGALIGLVVGAFITDGFMTIITVPVFVVIGFSVGCFIHIDI